MGDIITVHGSIGGADFPVMIGMANMTDNHGNSYSGFQITCAGKQPVKLGTLEWLAFNDGSQLAGGILFPWQTSGIEKKCRELNADGRTVPARPPAHRGA